GDLDSVVGECQLSRELAEPRAGLRANEVECAGRPVRRHFTRTQCSPFSLLGDTRGIRLFVRYAAVPDDQRIVETIRTGMVADVEVGTELRRCEVKLTADRVVAHTDGQQHERAADHE